MDIKRFLWKNKYIFLLVLISILVFLPFLTTTQTYKRGDWLVNYVPEYQIIYKNVIGKQEIPLWTPAIKAGWSLGNLAIPLLYPPLWIMMLLFGPIGALNLTNFFHHIFAMLGMYFLIRYLTKNQEAAFISSLLFGLSAFLIRQHPFWMVGVSYFPWLFLFLIKAFKEKKWVLYSVLVGILLALQLMGGGILQQYFIIIFLCFYLLFECLRKPKSLKRWVKAGLILVVFLAVFGGLGAIRLFYFLEWSPMTNRGQGVSLQESGKNPLTMDVFMSEFIKGTGKTHAQIGIIGVIFLLVCVWYMIKNREKVKNWYIFLFLLIMAGVNIVFATGIFHEFFYNYVPMIKSMRGLQRTLFVYVFSACAIIGIGLANIIPKLKVSKKTAVLIFLILVPLIFVDSTYFGPVGERIFYEETFVNLDEILDYDMIQFLDADDSIYRFHINEVMGIDSHDMTGASTTHDLEGIYGFFNPLWISEYFHNFMATTFRSKAKLWGMTNVKYLISSKEINGSDFEFVKEFEVEAYKINPAYTEGVAYVYENKRWLPRAFVVDNAALIIGNQNNVRQMSYSLMTLPNFDPSSIMLVMGENKKVEDYSLSELKKFDAIFLGEGSVTQNSGGMLQRYVEEGGVLIPNILNGTTTMTVEDIDAYFATVNGSYTELEYLSYYTDHPNSVKLDVGGIEGFVFISEKYPLYNGWKAEIDGKKIEFDKANGVFTGIYIEDGEELEFKFEPRSYVWGKRLSLVVLLIILIYFARELLANES